MVIARENSRDSQTFQIGTAARRKIRRPLAHSSTPSGSPWLWE